MTLSLQLKPEDSKLDHFLELYFNRVRPKERVAIYCKGIEQEKKQQTKVVAFNVNWEELTVFAKAVLSISEGGDINAKNN